MKIEALELALDEKKSQGLDMSRTTDCWADDTSNSIREINSEQSVRLQDRRRAVTQVTLCSEPSDEKEVLVKATEKSLKLQPLRVKSESVK